MTKRLEKALEQLTSDQIAQLTEYVESIGRSKHSHAIESPAEAKMDWVGALKDGPFSSGLEAQEAAKHHRLFLLERGMNK